jgi:hypothetical protein
MIRSPTWTLSRATPKLVGSALVLRGVLQQVKPVQSAVAGSATSAGTRLGPGTVIVGLVVVGGGALDNDKTRGCAQMRMRGVQNMRVPEVGRSLSEGRPHGARRAGRDYAI